MEQRRALVVCAHPSKESFCWAIRDCVKSTLEAGGAIVRSHDLYQDRFQPILSIEGWHEHYEPAPGVDELEHYRLDLAWAEILILIFPSWWYSLPAILKGYFDRVFTPGFAFHIHHGRIRPARLNGIRRVVILATFGSPEWWNRIVIGSPMKKMLGRGLRPLMARFCRISFVATYALDKRDDKWRAARLRQIEWAVRAKCLSP